MKLNKIIISLILMFSFCFSYGNVSALENEYIYTPTKEEFEKEQEKQIELMKATFGSARESYAYDYRKIGDSKLSSFSAYKDAYDNLLEDQFFQTNVVAFIGQMMIEAQAHFL